MSILFCRFCRGQRRIAWLIVGLSFFLSCQKRVPPAGPSPDRPSTGALLKSADQHYLSGEYREALSAYGQFLNRTGQRSQEILLRLAISYVMTAGDEVDSQQAVPLLEELSSRLTAEDPIYGQVRALLVLSERQQKLRREIKEQHQEIEKITTQLQKLKEIDARRRRN